MVREVLDLLAVRPGGTYVDGTVGCGGHARAILKCAGRGARLLAIDRDEEALAVARMALADWAEQCRFERGNFRELPALAARAGLAAADGILLDLGMSSLQVERAERGFSFMRDGPLDMRMDRRQSLTAADVVAGYGEADLAQLIGRLGGDPAARRIARAIVRARARGPVRTTGRLAEIVAGVPGLRRGRTHPATRTFQALRMAVNDEQPALEAALDGAASLLKPGARLVVLSYHSVEDGTVKRWIREHVGRRVSLPAGGTRWEGALPAVRRITRKPLTAPPAEVELNPRARSAKARAVERTG